MWTVLFGDNENEADSAQSVEVPVKTPVSPQHSTPPVTPSPLEPLVPTSPLPLSTEPRRVNPVVDVNSTKNDGENDESAMRMLLKRLNNLMIKVGEHEFEKRTLVDQMEKERNLLSAKITDLEKQMEDLTDQNVQLQYKVEYTSEPMLMERVQDITDMRDALAAVKKQLEAELQEKELEMRKLKATVAAKDKELNELRDSHEKLIEELTAEREAAREEAADAVRATSKVTSAKYEELLKEKDIALEASQEKIEALTASFAETELALRETKASAEEVKQELEAAQTQRMTDAKALEQLRHEFEQIAQEHEQKLQQVKLEGQHEVEALEKRVMEQKKIVEEKVQELGDYKHDCIELWKINEELKQQLALSTAETVVKQAESRTNALPDHTAFEDKIDELEKRLEEQQEQLTRKSQQFAELQKEADSHFTINNEVSGKDDDKFKVEEGDGGVISVLTEQIATAQRELTEAMELNLHLNNRNAWLEEQYQMLSSVQSEGDEEQEEASVTKLSPEKHITKLEQELREAHHVANEKAEHVANLEHNYSALSTEFDRLHAVHNELTEVQRNDDAMLNSLRQEIESLRAFQANAIDKDQALYVNESEIAELRSENLALISEAERFQQVHDELMKTQTDLNECQAVNATLQQELAVLRDVSDAALKRDEQLNIIEKELNQARSEKDAVVTQLTQSQEFVQELQLKMQNLEGIVSDQMNEKKSLEQQLQNLQEMAQENLENSYELQSSLETAMEELANVKVQLQSEREQCATLQQSIAEAKQSTISRAELDRVQSEVTHLEQKICHFQRQEQALKQQLQEAEHAKDAIAAELQTALSERVAAEHEQKRLQISFEQKLTSTQALSSELQRANDDLSRSLEQSQTKATQAEQQLSAMHAHQSEIQKQVETLTKKNLLLVSEMQNMRDEAERQQQVAHSQLEQLKVAHAKVQHQLADTTHSLQSKNAELTAATQRNQSDVAQLEDLANRYKADKQSSDQQVIQLSRECEHLRQTHTEYMSTLDRTQNELEQIRAQLSAVQQDKYSLEAKLGQLRELNDEKAHLLQNLDEHKRVNKRLEETNRELEDLLQKSKAYCEDVSRESENKVSRAQELARHVEQEAREEIDRIANENNLLRDELEQLAQTRFEETNAHDELRVKLAELLAENNVLSARAHRLTQQLSQYTDLPDDDEVTAAGKGQTPDLWELLSSGMEQLKADLELASKYAASIDASSVDGGMGDDSFTVSS